MLTAFKKTGAPKPSKVLATCLYTKHTQENPACHVIMITVFCRDCNEISQKSYDNLISSIDLINLECPVCGHRGCLSVHGYYERSVKEPSGGKIPIRILRVKCGACGHTHAILPSSIVPYSQISLSDQNEILDEILNLYGQYRSACAIGPNNVI